MINYRCKSLQAIEEKLRITRRAWGSDNWENWGVERHEAGKLTGTRSCMALWDSI